MASPQRENGYLCLANEIVDRLCSYRINGEDWLVLWTVLRKTYGFNKKEDAISLSQFEKITGLKRPNVARALNNLVSRKILASIKDDTGLTTRYSFQKDYEKWVVVSPVILGSIPGDKRVVSKVPKRVVSPVIHTKYNNTTKDNIQKTTTAPTTLIQKFFYGKYEEIHKKPYVPSWGKEGKLFKEILAVLPEEQIKALIISFLNTKDDFIIKAGYSVGVFKSQIPKLQTGVSFNEQEQLMREVGLKNDSNTRRRSVNEIG